MHFQPLRISHPIRNVRLVEPVRVAGMRLTAETKKLEEAAYERGRRDAEKELREQLIQQRSEVSTLSQGVLRSLRGAASDVVKQSEALLVELALEMSSRLLSGIPLDGLRIAANVREALLQVEETTEIRVQVHPEDLALLTQLTQTERPESDSLNPVQWIANASVQRGGCLVQTRFGFIDNQADAKLRALKSAVAI